MATITQSKSQDSIIKGQILERLKFMFGHLMGQDMSHTEGKTSFFELGADSLLLLQASQAIRDEFKVKVPFRLLLEELSTLDSLSEYLLQRLPSDFSKTQNKSTPSKPASVVKEQNNIPCDTTRINSVHERIPPPPISASLNINEEFNGTLQQIIDRQLSISEHQLQIMSMQLELLQSSNSNQSYESIRVDAQNAVTSDTQIKPNKAELIASENSAKNQFEPEVFVAYKPIEKGRGSELNDRQRMHLQALIERVVTKTPGSKRLTENYRPYLANNRASSGFRLLWKEMVYPLMIDRAQGCKIWDVDGNEYIDLTMGFGAVLFGHSPQFILDAMREELDRGVRLGGHSPIAGDVAKLICELTGAERVAFCNSGTEAVMSSLRLARAVTGRSKIAMFEGCYHGTFDGVMIRGEATGDGKLRALPLAPGVPEKFVEDVLLLKYNDPQSIDIIRSHGNELAAVLIEPPRSRRPDIQPAEFLHNLRKVTEEFGVALIFDEVVTGFRFHPGGAQAMFGIQADLVTYGKAVGGGVPVAVIAGKASFMDAIDGGMWQYGDNSFPQADLTFYAGTYFQHPLLMPALRAALTHIKESGQELQNQLAEKTERIANSINQYFEYKQLSLRIVYFGSLFRILHPPTFRYIDLFYYYLLEKGVFIAETRTCMLSTAHTDEDIDYIIRAFKEVVDEMLGGEFLQSSAPKLKNDTHANCNLRISLTEHQKQIWALSMMGDDASRAYNQSIALHFQGKIDISTLRSAIQKIVDRHEALRISVDADGREQEISASLKLNIPMTDLSDLSGEEQEKQLEEWLHREGEQVFDLTAPPLLSARILKMDEQYHILILTLHHIISDGWSMGIILNELKQLYSSACAGVSCKLPDPYRFSEYVKQQERKQHSDEMILSEKYWLEIFSDDIPNLELPSDCLRQENRTFNGAQKQILTDSSLRIRTKSFSSEQGCTVFMTLLGAFKVFLYCLTDQSDIVVGTPSAGQVQADEHYLVGYCVNLLPIRSKVDDSWTFTQYLRSLKNILSDVYDHQDYSFGQLLKKLNQGRNPDSPPPVSVIFNMDRSWPTQQLPGLQLKLKTIHNNSSKFDLTLDVTETEEILILDCEYNNNLFNSSTVHEWLNGYQFILQKVMSEPGISIVDLKSQWKETTNKDRTKNAQMLNQTQTSKLRAAKRQVIM